MSQRIIIGTIKAQLSSGYSLEDLKGENSKVFDLLSFTTIDMSAYGYTVVGTAEIIVTMNDSDQIISDKIDALRAEAKQVQADAYKHCTEIERKVQELLAITMDAGVSA